MANGKELATYNERAISLKQYLANESIKSQIMAAAPKMLNGERFLKVFYGAVLRNPKLMECTTESMLQAAMFFAQLGLEPILGRAYLVPYLNNKNIDGRWVKQYEVQAQVGYQGFVDLGRRSGLILDVWGACVYVNDLFDLSYGMDRTLVHKPWFMDPEKRKKGESGECIGAYVVWKLKDGTMHPDFMPIHEIHKRRAKSQAYTYAETGDPTKGGGKRDSVWHQWPEEMMLKTVIKHSAKLVPASIEFMQAVEFDDHLDNGRSTSMAMMFGSGPDKLPEPGSANFDTLAQEKGTNSAFDAFVKATADGNRMEVDAFKAKVMAEGRFDELWAAFEKTQPNAQAPAGSPPAPLGHGTEKTPPQQPSGGNGGSSTGPLDRKNWINLRGAGYESFVMANLEAIKAAPDQLRGELRGKWINVYKEQVAQGQKPWPLDVAPKSNPPQAPSSTPDQQKSQTQTTEDSMEAEFNYLLTTLKSKAKIDNAKFIRAAQKTLRYPEGVEHLDNCSIDALRELLEEVERIQAVN